MLSSLEFKNAIYATPSFEATCKGDACPRVRLSPVSDELVVLVLGLDALKVLTGEHQWAWQPGHLLLAGRAHINQNKVPCIGALQQLVQFLGCDAFDLRDASQENLDVAKRGKKQTRWHLRQSPSPPGTPL